MHALPISCSETFDVGCVVYRHNTLRHRRTEDRQTDDNIMPAADCTSAKSILNLSSDRQK